jgi:hypothetical protein
MCITRCADVDTAMLALPPACEKVQLEHQPDDPQAPAPPSSSTIQQLCEAVMLPSPLLLLLPAWPRSAPGSPRHRIDAGPSIAAAATPYPHTCAVTASVLTRSVVVRGGAASARDVRAMRTVPRAAAKYCSTWPVSIVRQYIAPCQVIRDKADVALHDKPRTQHGCV